MNSMIFSLYIHTISLSTGLLTLTPESNRGVHPHGIVRSLNSSEVMDILRTVMFILGMISVFIGISLLAPNEPKGEAKDSSLSSATLPRVNTEVERLIKPIEDSPIKDLKSFMRALAAKASAAVTRAKSTCTLLLVWEMMPHAWFISFLPKPMVFNKNRRDVNGLWGDRSKLMSLRSPTGWSRIPVVEESVNMLETTSSGED
ncbi:probable magnesium transporter NIPA8 isoform X1 [Tanacetum coccineum]|uniref:Probable magnesium transporter NIPA8 isoform X1 n=1 Tax=Tanacetum coccineum TaxID=301880 RepID=A0ABQ4ZBE9_9ASTR